VSDAEALIDCRAGLARTEILQTSCSLSEAFGEVVEKTRQQRRLPTDHIRVDELVSGMCAITNRAEAAERRTPQPGNEIRVARAAYANIAEGKAQFAGYRSRALEKRGRRLRKLHRRAVPVMLDIDLHPGVRDGHGIERSVDAVLLARR